MSRGGSGGAVAAAKGVKKKGSTFVIDCAKPVEDKIMDIASLEKSISRWPAARPGPLAMPSLSPATRARLPARPRDLSPNGQYLCKEVNGHF
ncbi:hypothetical protein C4D60_Mb01t28810 [Musa balbisiana]|uniref:Large ribosomal subunit protein eL22 n=1 Tax=Musa balbisiana TaxID=52838 RepID=A0A4S8JRG2_MUSBA|nr:hypothetical protein C4D60_Mb01t28810 [Musa balbisiana]